MSPHVVDSDTQTPEVRELRRQLDRAEKSLVKYRLRQKELLDQLREMSVSVTRLARVLANAIPLLADLDAEDAAENPLAAAYLASIEALEESPAMQCVPEPGPPPKPEPRRSWRSCMKSYRGKRRLR